MIGSTIATDIGDSIAVTMVRRIGSALPTSFNGNGDLFAVNLFLMTAFMCLGALMAGAMAREIWLHRGHDRARHPVTIWRLAWLFAGAALFLCCGTEAMTLWAWNPADPVTTARVLMAKRWIDPAALLLAAGWMTLVTLSNAAMEQQLSRRPLPVGMWARLPALRRPAAVVVLSFVAAFGAALTR